MYAEGAKPMSITIGRCLIPRLLQQRGWTQQDLADRTGVDKRTISYYCTNTRKKMPLYLAVTLADVLEVSPRDLFEWE
jgi:transcriptional regulator with XRE-family HTH domain